jgi:hypothetical protein
MANIQLSIQNQTFSQFKQEFLAKYCSWITNQVGKSNQS